MSSLEEEFRFSPRANRANEIQWRSWGKAAFEEAERARRPVLLAISGVWCHWCHVMDETSYSEPGIIRLINDHYVPIRVDTDRRPDINSRYNLGGWPTTAILSSQGELITGGTYIPPGRFLRLLQGMVRAFSEGNDGIVKRLAGEGEERTAEATAPESAAGTPDGQQARAMHQQLVEALRRAYDPVHGGFGREPKFPMVDALELMLEEHVLTGEAALLDMVVHSLAGMSGGGMYDHVEGGFFRYSTTRDWSIPHYEKMLKDNAELLGLLGKVFAVTGDRRWSDLAKDVHRFLQRVMFLPETGCWAGSQDADEEYYTLPESRRQQREAPFVDRTIYTSWNAMTARALVETGGYLAEPRWMESGEKTLEALWDLVHRPGLGVAHFVAGGEPGLFGQLEDNVLVGRAALAAHLATGSGRWLQISQELADWVMARFTLPGGGMRGQLPGDDAVGPLARPQVDPMTNAWAMEWLTALAATSPEAGGPAQRVLWPHRDLGGVAGAAYALAISARWRPWVTVTIPEGEAGFRQAALGVYLPHKALITASAQSRILLCARDRCLQPEDPMALAEGLRRLATPGARRGELAGWEGEPSGSGQGRTGTDPAGEAGSFG